MNYDPLSTPTKLPVKAPTLFGEDFNDKVWEDEWLEMPEFIMEDQEALQQIVLNFEFPEDVEAFGKLIGQTVTPKTRSLWFPKQEKEETKNFLWITE